MEVLMEAGSEGTRQIGWIHEPWKRMKNTVRTHREEPSTIISGPHVKSTDTQTKCNATTYDKYGFPCQPASAP